MAPFVHPQGICESSQVGEGTRIWAFAHVLPGARIGRDCNICDHVFIENDVVIGDRVTVKCGVQLWDGLRVADDVFIGPNVTFTNDKFPRSKRHREPLQTHIGRGASLSANCTVLPGLSIGADALIGAGAVVSHDVPPRAMVVGNPARITGYVGATKEALPAPEFAGVPPDQPAAMPPSVQGASLHRLPCFTDMRGSVSVGNFGSGIPFVPQRYYVVYQVPAKEVRGERAYRTCAQFLVCVMGNVTVLLDDGHRRTNVRLDDPTIGVYVPPMIWSVQYQHSPDAVVLVFASHPYDPDDYIRDYEEFLRLVC